MDAHDYKAAGARLRTAPLWFSGVLLLISPLANASNTWFDKADVDRVNREMRERGREEERRTEQVRQSAAQNGRPLPRVVTRAPNEPGTATPAQRPAGMRMGDTVNSPAPREVRSYSPPAPSAAYGSSDYECDKSAQSARNEAGSIKKNYALTNAAYDIANSKCRSAAGAGSDKSSSLACEQARRAYENEASSLRKDSNAISAKRRAMQEECGG